MNYLELLEGVDFLNIKQKEEFLNSGYLGVKWSKFISLHEEFILSKGLVSDFNNEVLKLIVENAGDWNDCLPYSPDSFDKLSDEDKIGLFAHVDKVNKVIDHFNFRQTSLWGD